MESTEKYKNQLLSERKRIINKIDSINNKESSYEGLRNSWKKSTGELSSYDNHPADNASDTFERGKDLGIKDNANLFLTMIDDALNKIAENKYGICDKCGKKINEDRLEIMPYTTICYGCKTKDELKKKEMDRPLKEETLLELNENMYLNEDNTDKNFYDGEDTWQDLAKVGTSNTRSESMIEDNNFFRE